MSYLGPIGPDGIWEKIIFDTSLQSKCAWVWLSYISGDFFFFFYFKKRFSLIKLELSQKEKKMVIEFELKWRFLWNS